jgi:hypothetical protein
VHRTNRHRTNRRHNNRRRRAARLFASNRSKIRAALGVARMCARQVDDMKQASAYDLGCQAFFKKFRVVVFDA